MPKRERKPKAEMKTAPTEQDAALPPPEPEPHLSVVPPLPAPPPGAVRRYLPVTRKSITRTFRIPNINDNGVVEEFGMYVTVGMFDDGMPGEIFIKADKAGSLLRGAFDVLGVSLSLGLQHGVPLESFTVKMRGTKFGPNGFLGAESEFKSCTSPFDLLAQWLDAKFAAKPAEDAR